MPEPIDDTPQLLTRWHGGDRRALESLVERHRDWIHHRVRARRGVHLRQHCETVDDFQDLVVSILEYAPRFQVANEGQFRGLLARMIENQLAGRARRLGRIGGREQALVSSWRDSCLSLDPSVRTATRPDAAAERSEAIAWMRLGLEFLPTDERELVFERQFEERSFLEIGAHLDAGADAVRMRYSRALLRLAGIIERLQRGELGLMLETEQGSSPDSSTT